MNIIYNPDVLQAKMQFYTFIQRNDRFVVKEESKKKCTWLLKYTYNDAKYEKAGILRNKQF